MGSDNYPLQQRGIYHNLPQFDPSIKDLTAIVTGANGISGFHTCRALLDSPARWSKIYAMSRRPPPEEMLALLTPEQREKIQHVASDFLKSPEDLAEAMRDAGVDQVDCESGPFSVAPRWAAHMGSQSFFRSRHKVSVPFRGLAKPPFTTDQISSSTAISNPNPLLAPARGRTRRS
jgi:hypothetical protein